MPKFGTKNALFGYFLAEILKSFCRILNQHHQVCKISKFFEETKMPKFGTKNALFSYIWARILKSFCCIWNQHPKVCQISKFCEIKTCSSLELKTPYLGIFGVEF